MKETLQVIFIGSFVGLLCYIGGYCAVIALNSLGLEALKFGIGAY